MPVAEFRYVTTYLYQSGSTPNAIISELPFTGVNFTQQLNSVGTFQGHVLLSGINAESSNAYEGTVPGKTILWVLYTDPEDGITTPVWSGVIWAREYDSATQTLGISAQEMMSLYGRRRISTDKDYSNNPSNPNGYDPAYIAQQLMQYAEGLTHGKTGLNTTLFVGSTIFNTKKKYEDYELKSVYQAIKDLSSGYFDFTIKPRIVSGSLVNYLVIQQTMGSGYSTTNPYATVFDFPGNLIEYKFPEDASGAANKLYGLGYGNNKTKYVAVAIDPSKITTGDWPLLEDTTNYTDIGELKLLKDLTLGQLNAISYPPTTIEVVIPPYIDPLYTYYAVGDQVRLSIKDDYFPNGINFGNNNDPLRVMAISVNPGENGPSRITLTLTRPLSTFGTVS
jgi:hypothetical protein